MGRSDNILPVFLLGFQNQTKNFIALSPFRGTGIRIDKIVNNSTQGLLMKGLLKIVHWYSNLLR